VGNGDGDGVVRRGCWMKWGGEGEASPPRESDVWRGGGLSWRWHVLVFIYGNLINWSLVSVPILHNRNEMKWSEMLGKSKIRMQKSET